MAGSSYFYISCGSSLQSVNVDLKPEIYGRTVLNILLVEVENFSKILKVDEVKNIRIIVITMAILTSVLLGLSLAASQKRRKCRVLSRHVFFFGGGGTSPPPTCNFPPRIFATSVITT